jgi:peptide/nickel transport system permease protein
MGGYLARRITAFIPTLVVVSFLVYMMIHLVPGDPTAIMLGQEATPEQRIALRAQLGLDKGFGAQVAAWYGNAARGNLGDSFFLHKPVTTALIERLPVTLSVTLFALVFATLGGGLMGVVAGINHGRLADWALMLLAIIGLSIPVFWLALNFIFLFAVRLHALPTSGYVPLSDGIGPYVKHLVLPGLTLGIVYTALIARMARSSMVEVLRQDYVRTARAKGLRARTSSSGTPSATR